MTWAPSLAALMIAARDPDLAGEPIASRGRIRPDLRLGIDPPHDAAANAP